MDALPVAEPPAKGENRASWFWLLGCVAVLAVFFVVAVLWP